MLSVASIGKPADDAVAVKFIREKVRRREVTRTRWTKIARNESPAPGAGLDEEDDDDLENALFERVQTFDMKVEQLMNRKTKKKDLPKLFDFTKLIKAKPKGESQGTNVSEIVSKASKADPELLKYKNTIYDNNWNKKRSISGYFGCGGCEVCQVSKFGDKFKIERSGHWFQITDNLDCEAGNVLYLATWY